MNENRLPDYIDHIPDAIGPQNEAEQRLYDLVMESVNGPPPEQTTVTELIAELRARIQTRR